MKQKLLSFIQRLFFTSIILIPSLCTADLPYPGQNIWHVTADIGTEVDALSSKLDACCIGTFTTLAADFNGTFTAIAASSLCDPTPITGPTAIASSGSYCLANDVSGNIFIGANNVTLDLNGYAFGTISVNPVVNVTIQNGTSTTAGTVITVTNAIFLTIKNIVMSGGTSAGGTASLNLLSCQNCRIENCLGLSYHLTDCIDCSLENCSGNDFNVTTATSLSTTPGVSLKNCISHGFNISGHTAVTLEDCIASGTTNSIGYSLSNITGSSGFNILKNCIFNASGIATTGFSIASPETQLIDCLSVGGAFGFTNTSAGTNCQYINCTSDNATNGFVIQSNPTQVINCQSIGGAFGFVNSSGGTNCQYVNCTSNGALSIGFTIQANTSQVENCKAIGGATGFSVASASNITFEGCTASGYSGAGSIGFNLLNAGANCTVIGCTANGIAGTTGQIGFQGASTPANSRFYLNRASNNGSRNYSAGITTANGSATVSSINVAGAATYGDNLAAPSAP